MAAKTAEIRVKIEPEFKKKAKKIFNEIGLTESEAIRIFLRNVVKRKEFPLELKVPNAETRKAIEDVEKGNTIGPFESIEEMFKELES